MKIPEIIKNPLTLLSIFAGLSDIAMTAVLPFLPSERQEIFMWFVMGYPLLLVCGFFYILIWKREALYAPSDFRDDATWLKVLKDEEKTILSKYPLEPAITCQSEATDVSNQIEEDVNQLESNYFYKFLRSIGLTYSNIKQIISNVDNVDKLPEMVAEITHKKETSERIKRVLYEFPHSSDDFYKLKSMFKE